MRVFKKGKLGQQWHSHCCFLLVILFCFDVILPIDSLFDLSYICCFWWGLFHFVFIFFLKLSFKSNPTIESCRWCARVCTKTHKVHTGVKCVILLIYWQYFLSIIWHWNKYVYIPIHLIIIIIRMSRSFFVV